ncbi:uncharacterized [Lates japonicus]
MMAMIKVYLLMFALGAAVILSNGNDLSDDEDSLENGSGEGPDNSTSNSPSSSSSSSSSTTIIYPSCLVYVLVILCMLAH